MHSCARTRRENLAENKRGPQTLRPTARAGVFNTTFAGKTISRKPTEPREVSPSKRSPEWEQLVPRGFWEGRMRREGSRAAGGGAVQLRVCVRLRPIPGWAQPGRRPTTQGLRARPWRPGAAAAVGTCFAFQGLPFSKCRRGLKRCFSHQGPCKY